MNEQVIIGFSRPRANTVFSWGIRTVENTPFSHTYIRYYSKRLDRWLVYHADQADCHFNNFPSFLSENRPVEEYIIPCTQEEKTAIEQMCIDKVGLKYGWWQIAGMALSRISRLWFDVSVKNPFSDGEKTMVCSEFVGRILRILGESIRDEDLEIEGPKWIRNKTVDLYNKRSLI
jgi:hypothetical protein